MSAAFPLVRDAEQTLADQLAARYAQRIDEHALKPGTRLASIRAAAAQHGVSRTTVVDAYERLIAGGYVESRRGSGFYVRARAPRAAAPRHARAAPAAANDDIDIVWLLRHQLRQAPAVDHPGAGLLPATWLDSALVNAAVRAVGRSAGDAVLGYGEPQGHLPLRVQLAQRLALFDIDARPEQILTTAGVTAGIDLVTRHLAAPGDTVFVEDPAWYLMFGRLAAAGIKLVGVPRRADGPDLAALRNLLTRYQPKLFVLSSVLHNPTGTSLSAANAHGLLKLAEQYGFLLIEDDVYGDLHPGRALRLASLDQLRRVVYLGGFSKTLAANLRVGFIAASTELIGQLVDLKMLTGLTSPELNERVVARILIDGHYRRHVERLRGKLASARERTARALEKMGVRLFEQQGDGMFLWGDFGRDTNAIAAEGSQRGILCAPGSLFSPTQLPSHWMRVSAAAALNPQVLRFLAAAVEQR